MRARLRDRPLHGSLSMLAAGWRASAGNRFVAGRGEGDGVRSREERAARFAPWLQPPGADGRRRLKAPAYDDLGPARARKRCFGQLKPPVATLSFALAVTQQFGLGTEATQQLVLVEDHFLDGVRWAVQPARVVFNPLRDP